MQVQAYLNFDGRCEEALEFYKKALGAEVQMLMRFNQSPEPAPPGMMPPNTGNKIMHSSFRIGDTVVNASDCHCKGHAAFQGISLALTVDSDSQCDRAFNALGDGGKINQPLSKTFFSSRFGVVTDRFGVTWMVLVAPPQPSPR
jgi:PhnB protein